MLQRAIGATRELTSMRRADGQIKQSVEASFSLERSENVENVEQSVWKLRQPYYVPSRKVFLCTNTFNIH